MTSVRGIALVSSRCTTSSSWFRFEVSSSLILMMRSPGLIDLRSGLLSLDDRAAVRVRLEEHRQLARRRGDLDGGRPVERLRALLAGRRGDRGLDDDLVFVPAQAARRGHGEKTLAREASERR